MTRLYRIVLAVTFSLSGLAVAQGQAVRDVGVNPAPGAAFHGTLGSSSLDGFRGFSSGIPMLTGQSSSGPLDPTGRAPITSTPGGLLGSYRVTGSPTALSLDPASPIVRRGPGDAGPSGMLPLGALAPAASSPGAGLLGQLPSLLSRGTLPPLDVAAGSGAPLQSGRTELIAIGAIPTSLPLVQFDLAGQLKASQLWKKAMELLAKQEYAKAAEAIRVGLVFSPGRPEGEWLLAVVDVALEDYSDAVCRLRNSLAISPDLLSGPRGAADLLGPTMVEQRVAAAAGDNSTSSPERLLVAAWLAYDAGRTDQAKSLLTRATDLIGSALPVAGALRQAPGLAVMTKDTPPIESPRPSVPAAVSAIPAVPSPTPTAGAHPAADASPQTNWLPAEQGGLMGLPPAQYHCTFTRPQTDGR